MVNNAPRDSNRVTGIIGADSSTQAATPATIDHTDSGVWTHLVGTGSQAAFVIGQDKISASAVQLPTAALVNGVIFTAKSTNTGNIFIGGSGVTTTADGTGNGYILEPGNSVSAAVTNLNLFYVIGTANDVLSWIGS